MNLYIAGPMRGKKNFNFPMFDAVAALYRRYGHTVFNPAERDVKKHGKKISENEKGSLEVAEKQHGFSLRLALADDTAWICKQADGLVMLPGWRKSNGAKAEHALAKALGLRITYLNKKLKVKRNVN